MAVVITFVTLAAAGAVPLWNAVHSRLAGEVATGTSATTRAALHARQRLLTLQVCSTSVVMIASGLFVRSVQYSFRTAAGFDMYKTVFVSVQERSVICGDK